MGGDLYRFMFALETGYVFLSRLMLAKTMSDAVFPALDAVASFRRELRQQGRRGHLGWTA